MSPFNKLLDFGIRDSRPLSDYQFNYYITGGHYTTYAKNFLNNKWYEFDDQFVTQVSESTVTAAEAYVLFYW